MLYSGLSGQYVPNPNHDTFARTQYIPCTEFEGIKPPRPLWPDYLAVTVTVIFLIVLFII